MLQHVNQSLKIAEDAYAWRYISFQQLWNIIYHNEIYFTRIDLFDDPMEGMPLSIVQLISQKVMKRDENTHQHFKDLTESIRINKIEIEKWQKGISFLVGVPNHPPQ